MASNSSPSRLTRAVRDLAVFAASRARQPWTRPWEQVADELVVSVDLEGSDDELTTCHWAFPASGVAGNFETSPSAVVADLADRVGDVAAELWRA